MAEYTPRHGISYPGPQSNIKDSSSPAKLAADIQQTAQTTDSAIEAAKAAAINEASPERGLMPAGTNVTSWTNKAYEGWWDIDSASLAETITGLPPEAQGMPGRFMMSAAANRIPFQLFMTYGSGAAHRNQKGVYYRTILWFNQPYDEWVNLIPKQQASQDTSQEHLMRESELRRRRGRIRVKGKAAVALIFDHGTNNFHDHVLPALKANNLPATLALNSQMYDPSQSRYEYDNQTSWAMIQGWSNNDRIEIANHGRTHADFSDPKDLEHEIRGGREELEEHLGFPIDSWVQVGVSGGNGYGGFDNGSTPESYWETPAGRIILSAHAVATGSLPHPRFYPLDGTISQGMTGFWVDGGASSISSAQDQIQSAIDSGTGVIIRSHPEVMGRSGNTTPAQMSNFLGWVKARKDAGEIEVLQLRDFAIAEKAAKPIRVSSGIYEIGA